MYLGKADVNTYEKGAGREFLVSNGRGGYGFSTVIGANTRKEHGLLVVRPDGETEHSVLVSKIEETIFDKNKKYQLSTNRYKDLVYPDGYRYVQEYQGNPFPSMLFVIHSILLKKSIFMPQGENTTIIKYELLAAPDKIRLDLRPLFAHRKTNETFTSVQKEMYSVSTQEAELIGIDGNSRHSFCNVTKGTWSVKPLWFENIIYEQNDNADTAEPDNLWSPGFVSNEISEGECLYVTLSDKPVKYTLEKLHTVEKASSDRFENVLEQANIPALNSAEQDMIFASYHLIDDREDGVSPIYTGYPSVISKARETFIALPGLTLATGRDDAAKRTLEFWGKKASENEWVVPESISDDGSAVYGNIDNGLLFVYAADKYIAHTAADGQATVPLIEVIQHIVDKYLQGITELDCQYMSNGLLFLYGDGMGRHWMSSVVDGETVVKRNGYLVEVNALWYNALRVAEKYSQDSVLKAKYSAAAVLCAQSFNETFWDNEICGLLDCVTSNSSADKSIRPNQIWAISLPNCPLSDEKGRAVLRLCWDELYTTYGLRTLNPRHDKFKGRSEGRADQRQKARFRGMAWTYLLGQFITAYLKYNPSRKEIGWIFMRPFHSHVRHGCLGGIAEYFDGIMPYKPHGDVLSAAALGELLRVLYENLEKED